MNENPRRRSTSRRRSVAARLVGLLLLALVANLMDLPSGGTPARAAVTEYCWLDTDGDLTCPGDPEPEAPTPTYAPPDLLNPRLVAQASPDQAGALRRLQDEAVSQVLDQHQLPNGDRDDVKSWGRNDALAMLWALVVKAVDTAEGQRTSDQQLVVDWLESKVRGQAIAVGDRIGEEYVKWAGLDLATYYRKAWASEDELRAFLSQQPVSYNSYDRSDATGGYCVYRSPEPNPTEYTGYNIQTCYTPCLFYCATPTPSFDQFVRWGESVATAELRSAESLGMSMSTIAGIAAIGAALTGFALAGATAAVFSTASIGSFLAGLLFSQVFATVTTSAIAGYFGVAIAGGFASLSTVVLAIVALVLESIKQAADAALPGKIAAVVAASHRADYDPALLMTTEEGRTSMLAQFTFATLPSPSPSACDNSLIPLHKYGRTDVSGEGTHDPVTGQVVMVSNIPCLNAPPIAEADEQADARFFVRAEGSPYTTARSSVAMAVPGGAQNASSMSVRMSGRWFAQSIKGADGSTRQVKTLGLTFRDWDGRTSYVTSLRSAEGDWTFVGLTDTGNGSLDPESCKVDGSCWNRASIKFLGADNRKYEAFLDDYRAPLAPPAHAATSLAGSPVRFEAGGFAPVRANWPVATTWRFQRDGCGGPCTDTDGETDAPRFAEVTGGGATYTWNQQGTYRVELVAEDAAGQRVVSRSTVRVSTPPRLTVFPDCDTSYVQCSPRNGEVGRPLVLWGKVVHQLTNKSETETVTVAWGDGVVDRSTNLHDGSAEDATRPVRFGQTDPATAMVMAVHTYQAPGVYHGTMTVRDDVEGLEVTEAFTMTIAATE